MAWLAGPALLYHQTEEWVWPGGFLPWFNRSVMGGTDEFPITRRSQHKLAGTGLPAARGSLVEDASELGLVRLVG